MMNICALFACPFLSNKKRSRNNLKNLYLMSLSMDNMKSIMKIYMYHTRLTSKNRKYMIKTIIKSRKIIHFLKAKRLTYQNLGF